MTSKHGQGPASGRPAAPLKIAGVYAFIGCLWILLSDQVVALFFHDQETITRVSMFKGWVYVAVTALLVYGLVKRAWSDLEKTQDELRKSEARYRLISENTGDVIWLLDMSTRRFTYVSPSVQRLRGFSANEVLGQRMEDVLTKESYAMIAERLPDRLAGFEAGDESLGMTTTQVDQTRRDGSVVTTEVVTTLLTDKDGRVSSVLGVSRDITDRLRAEEALRLSEEKFSKAFKSSPVWVSISTLREGRFLEVNDTFTSLTGFSRGETLGRTSHDLKMWADSDTLDHAMEQFRQEGRLRDFQVRMRFKDQQLHDMLWSAEPITLEGRECFISVMLDLTEHKRSQSEKILLEAQLHQAQKMEAIGTLAGGIAHDFNNILGAVIGYGELAHEMALAGRSNAKEVGQILKAAERARGLVRQILTFSRKVAIEPRTLELNTAVAETVALLERTIPRMIRIETILAPDLAPVHADPNQIEQVLLNLVGNAADAMPEGGLLTIETSQVALDGSGPVAGPDSMLGSFNVLRVSDTGLGMAGEVAEHLFEPFFTTKEIGKGTGLGLSTVYGIVKEHGGHIHFESQPGQGTTFQVFLPVSQGAPHDLEAAADSAPAPSVGQGTILLADDEEALLALCRRLLENEGYTVITAGNGEEALARYRAQGHAIDLVILDLGMPGMGGMKCLRELLAINSEIKVLIASGYSSSAQVEEALASGASGFVAKPYTRAVILNSVRQAL